ncbi:MAG: hypothetical protein IKY10_03950, partial [Clostridia bacterium]|nr:hypothetical protein [Clostridia bacterium]
MENLIEHNFKITSILSRTSKGLLSRILKQFANKNILLWQEKYLDYPCETIIVNDKSDLLKLMKATINEFDLLIIDNLDIKAKSKKLINFIKSISKMEEFKNKQVVLLFNNKDSLKNGKLNDFKSYKRVI